MDAEIRELTPTPSAAVRLRARSPQLRGLFDEHLPNIAHRLADMGVQPAGPPYARYHEYGPLDVDVEIGIPVASPVPNVPPLADAPPGEMASSELPGGPAAITVLRGSYAALPETYQRLHDWIHEQGRARTARRHGSRMSTIPPRSTRQTCARRSAGPSSRSDWPIPAIGLPLHRAPNVWSTSSPSNAPSR